MAPKPDVEVPHVPTKPTPSRMPAGKPVDEMPTWDEDDESKEAQDDSSSSSTSSSAETHSKRPNRRNAKHWRDYNRKYLWEGHKCRKGFTKAWLKCTEAQHHRSSRNGSRMLTGSDQNPLAHGGAWFCVKG